MHTHKSRSVDSH